MSNISSERLLRRPEVEVMTGLRKSAIYKLMKTGAFPPQVKLSGNSSQSAVAWRAADIVAWINSRPVAA